MCFNWILFLDVRFSEAVMFPLLC